MTLKTLTILALLIVAGCAAAVDRRSDGRAQTAEERWPPVGQFVDVGGRRVHARVTGSGPDVVLIHGASGNLRDMTFRLADALDDRYRVIAFDRPGMGYTDRAAARYDSAFGSEAESPREQARMLAAAARKLGVTRPVVLGHSYGGAVAMAWALESDPAALVVVSGATMPWPGDLGLQYTLLGSSVGGALLSPLVAATAGQGTVESATASIFRPQGVPARYLDHIGPGLTLRPGSLRANARQVNTLRPHVVEMSRRYPSLTLPVELVHGSADTIVPPDVHSKRLVDLLPNARLTMLNGVGHMPHQVATGAVTAAVDRAAARAGLR